MRLAIIDDLLAACKKELARITNEFDDLRASNDWKNNPVWTANARVRKSSEVKARLETISWFMQTLISLKKTHHLE